jgi:hypothetical protein
MGKVTDFGHPTVLVSLRPHKKASGGYEQLIHVEDAATGEGLLAGRDLKKVDEYLNNLGYKWLEGSSGVWHQ